MQKIILLNLFIIFFYCPKVYQQNTAPIANADTYTFKLNQTKTIDASIGVLFNDTDNSGSSTLTANPNLVSPSANGVVSMNTDGSFSFVPQTGFVGTTTFEYQVCDNGMPIKLVSEFDFDSTPLTTASVGPDANSINPDAVQTDCGIRIPSDRTGSSVGLDVNVPNTSSIFNFTSFVMEFEYADRESQANIVEGGNFRIYHISSNNIGVTINVINSNTGISTSYTVNLGPFLSGTATYNIEYNEISGDIIYTANGTTTSFSNVAPDFSPIDTSLASDVIIGKNLDNAGNALPSLCRISINDTSKLCATGTVTLEAKATIITNRQITYRVKK